MKPSSIVIIGSGFSSLSAACYLAKAGYSVTVLEKNKTVGGRARQLKHKGFTFDMGPTFYWMPDVFERFFNDFGKKPSDYYKLEKLDPAYRVYFDKKEFLDISGQFEEIVKTFESIEEGSGNKLKRFINKADTNYQIAIKDLVYQPGQNVFEIINFKTLSRVSSFFRTIKGQISNYVTDPRLKKTLEFPVLFLGAKPSKTPAFYNFMNYADFKLGTWHPMGGMHQVIQAMAKIAEGLGVEIITNVSVNKLQTNQNKVSLVWTSKGGYAADIVLSGADYHHTERLLEKKHRQYSDKYWKNKTYAPSALLFYVGFDKEIKNVKHHTLFFDSDFDHHAAAIYDNPEWPEKPLFYASFPSKTDSSCAPMNTEAGIFLIPLAPDLEDSDELREKYFKKILNRLESLTDQKLGNHILFKFSYGIADFKSDYNAYKGNAYGLANTLMQTHILRPKLKSKTLSNLYFCGQLTVPGPGVPPSLISGKLASQLIEKYHPL